MSIVYIGIGSNLGSRKENCKRAISFLEKEGIRVLKLSSMIENAPWGVREQPEFINMVIETETDLGPDDLLKILKKTESAMGRQPVSRWGPRVIDLDILFYDNLVIKTPDLEVPHPGIKDRVFVLKPLLEIAPDMIHPMFQKSIRELLNDITGQS